MKKALVTIFTRTSLVLKLTLSLIFTLVAIIIITKLIQSELSNHFEDELSQQQSLYLEKMIQGNKFALSELSSRWLAGKTYKLLEKNTFNSKSWSGRLLGLADATKNEFGSQFFLTYNKDGEIIHEYNTREEATKFNGKNKDYLKVLNASILSELNETGFIVLETGEILSIHIFPITDNEFNVTNFFAIITDLSSSLKKFSEITNLDISISNINYRLTTKENNSNKKSDYFEIRILKTSEISNLKGHPCFEVEADKRKLKKSLNGFTNKIFIIFGFVATIFILLYYKTVQKLRHQEAKSYEASRLSSLGEMAGGMAHEINNPLTLIQGYALKLKILSKKNKLTSDEVIELSDLIIKVVHRITNIIKSLRNLSRNDENSELKIALVDDIVNDAIYLSEHKFKLKNVDLIYENRLDPIKVSCRRVELSRILINLLNNALDAVLSEEDSESKRVKVEVTAKEDFVYLSVTDSGPGIPVDIQNKIMEPFFTTKDVGVGTGLGLSLSLQIAKAHSGDLTLQSKPGKTIFTLKIPKLASLSERPVL